VAKIVASPVPVPVGIPAKAAPVIPARFTANPTAPPPSRPVAVAKPVPARKEGGAKIPEPPRQHPDRVQELPAQNESRGRSFWVILTPAAFLVLALLGVVLRDFFSLASHPAAPVEVVDGVPRLEVRFHDESHGDDLEALYLTEPQPTMRFGLVMLQNGKPAGAGLALKRLTFDPWGRTNNTCLRFDGNDERLFGSAAPKG